MLMSSRLSTDYGLPKNKYDKHFKKQLIDEAKEIHHDGMNSVMSSKKLTSSLKNWKNCAQPKTQLSLRR